MSSSILLMWSLVFLHRPQRRVRPASPPAGIWLVSWYFVWTLLLALLQAGPICFPLHQLLQKIIIRPHPGSDGLDVAPGRAQITIIPEDDLYKCVVTDHDQPDEVSQDQGGWPAHPSHAVHQHPASGAGFISGERELACMIGRYYDNTLLTGSPSQTERVYPGPTSPRRLPWDRCWPAWGGWRSRWLGGRAPAWTGR